MKIKRLFQNIVFENGGRIVNKLVIVIKLRITDKSATFSLLYLLFWVATEMCEIFSKLQPRMFSQNLENSCVANTVYKIK